MQYVYEKSAFTGMMQHRANVSQNIQDEACCTARALFINYDRDKAIPAN